MTDRLNRAVLRAGNQASLQDFMAIELGAIGSDEPVGERLRDALIAVLESSVAVAHELREAAEELELQAKDVRLHHKENA